MDPLRMSWQMHADGLLCRWSEAGEQIRYTPPWLKDVVPTIGGGDSPVMVPASTRISPFGGGTWFGPHTR